MRREARKDRVSVCRSLTGPTADVTDSVTGRARLDRPVARRYAVWRRSRIASQSLSGHRQELAQLSTNFQIAEFTQLVGEFEKQVRGRELS